MALRSEPMTQREVAILTDRSDISEEIVRLRAHCASSATIDEAESSTKARVHQPEMGREIK